MKNFLMLVVGFVMLLSFSVQVFADPFQNGSFEEGPEDVSGFITLGAGSDAIDGWITSGSIDLIDGYWPASEGDRSIDLNGNAIGAISQTFDTIAGAWYQVRFDMAGNPDGEQGLKVLVASTDTMAQEYDFDSTGLTVDNMQWTEKSFIFQAADGSTTLSFASDISGAYGPAIDNVRVNILTQAFPEDVMAPMGAVHARDNVLWPPNNKKVPVKIGGYVKDELSIARDGEGIGVSSAYILINGRKKIILRNDDENNPIDLIDDDGKFSIVKKFRAKKGRVYTIELFAWDTAVPSNFDLVDSTKVRVPKNMSNKKAKPKKKHKKKK